MNNRQNTAIHAVRSQIEGGGERVWRFADFRNLPPAAVAQSLSRLTRLGLVQRLGKGLYYHGRSTPFGPSKPNTSLLRAQATRESGVFPSGVSAANLLGFTTQNPARIELATDRPSLPRLIVGNETVIHTRRPASWRSLSQEDAALLDFLRNRGATSEMSPRETVRRLLALVAESGRLARLLKVAPSEPPRVRAMLGAIAEQLGMPETRLKQLRASLNPLSRFDFGVLGALEHAAKWQAKGAKRA